MQSSHTTSRSPSATHFLIADDEYSLHRLLQAFLTRLGHQATMVETGLKAVQAVQAHPQRFTCVILDIMMPQMNGIDAAQAIHRLAPTIPIVFMTAWTAYEVPRDLHIAGFLHKPFTFGEFSELVQRISAAIVE